MICFITSYSYVPTVQLYLLFPLPATQPGLAVLELKMFAMLSFFYSAWGKVKKNPFEHEPEAFMKDQKCL